MATIESSSSSVNCASFMDHIMSLNLCLPFLKMFLQIDSSSFHIAKSLYLLKKQEEKYQGVIYSSQLKIHILFLKLGLPFLEIFLRVSNNEDLKLRIEGVLYDVRLELHLLANTPIDRSLILDLEHVYTNLQEKLKNVIIKPNTQEYDVIFLDQYSPLMRVRLKRINEFLLQISGDLLRCKANLITTLIPEIEGIKELLILMQPLHTYLVGSWASFPSALVVLLDKAARLLYICLVDKMDEETALAMKHNLSNILKMINVDQIYLGVLRASQPRRFEHKKFLNHGSHIIYNMIQLLDCNARSLQYVSDTGEMLHDKLKFLYTEIEGLPYAQGLANFNYLVSSIGAIALKSIPILYSCHVKHMKEDMAKRVHSALSEVMDQIDHIEEDACRCITLYNYPKIGGLSFLDHFLGHLKEISIASPKFREKLSNPKLRENIFGTLYEEFDSLRSFLRKIEEQHGDHKGQRNLWTRIVGLAYEAEYVIDIYLLKEKSRSHSWLYYTWLSSSKMKEETLGNHIIMSSLSKIIRQAKLIKADQEKAKSWIYDEEKYDHNHPQAQDVANTPSYVSSLDTDNITDKIVGFREDLGKIMDYLLGNQQQLDFISIAGMPGIGKTTLAKKIYEHFSDVQHFDVRAWCTVSQTYQTMELLKTILGDLVTVVDDIKMLITFLGDNDNDNDNVKVPDDIKKSNDKNVLRGYFYEILKESNDESKLRESLYKILKERRYLIVFDDIWDMKAWNEMQRCFPNDNNHSRILITTRYQSVASKIKKCSKVHALQRLTDAQSRRLFQKTLQPKESFSEDFLEAENQIVQSCKGLPLAIVVIARLLAKVEKSVHEWNKIARSLSSHILDSQQSPCMAILELSYNHLPDHLKSCFLYFGAFPEDVVIPVQKLKQLWIAEGFVCNSGAKNLEDVAEDYFRDLNSRSLIIPITERSLEGTKSCCVHDLLHEFCLKKAEQESFFQWRENQNRNHDYFGSEVYNRRLIISNEWKPSSSFSVRSLLGFPPLKVTSIWYLSFVCNHLKLLKVLELRVERMLIGDCQEIELLIQLRYLAIYVDRFGDKKKERPCLPSKISHLSNLQYLFWSLGRNYKITHMVARVPLWEMRKLRHVHIYPSVYFNCYLDGIEEISRVHNLEKLSLVRFRNFEEVGHLRRLPKLQKLSCVFDADQSTKRLLKLDFLDRLVSLKVMFELYKGQRCTLKFPSNLQKLTLSKCPVPWEEISELGATLPNLKVLKIDGNCRSGYERHDVTWNVNDEDFPQLKYLKLSNLTYFCKWIALDDSFPELQQLVLESCKNLEEIPYCFGGSYTLQMITVKDCETSVKESAKRIQMDQNMEMGNEQLKLYLS